MGTPASTASSEELIWVDGQWLVRVWHGGLVHPYSGVRGGLVDWSVLAVSRDGVEVEPPPVWACRYCGITRDYPLWAARRTEFCSRRCAALARNRSGHTKTS